jgi:hypothetical protein
MNVVVESREECWEGREAPEEEAGCSRALHQELQRREIQRNLDDVNTILVIGGGAEAFSISLAGQGYSVTHLDSPAAMLELARQTVENQTNLHCVPGNSTDLSQFEDRFFDLVLNMDGAISFCGFDAERAIMESCRVTKKKLILTVPHRSTMVGNWISSSIHATGRISPAVHALLDRGEWLQAPARDNSLNSFGSCKSFLPGELKKKLNEAGLIVRRLGGLGSLLQLCDQETLRSVTRNIGLFNEFCGLCERYDREVLPDGPGTSARAGLIAVAHRPEYLVADDWGLSW